MSNIFYFCALILCILWAIGYFLLTAGIFIHILLVIALIAVILSIAESKEVA
ncbi:MAG: lmo0937 family membrane protein [Chitinophagaceae bacterium]|nr:lmo0937 family membrane protein [Chitinophagaceae bacterium]